MAIYKITQSWVETRVVRQTAFVVAESESELGDFLSDVGMDETWQQHVYDTDSSIENIDDHDYEWATVSENDLTNAGLKKNKILNITQWLRNAEGANNDDD